MKTEKIDKKVVLSTLWIFATLNYVYCDVMGLMDAGLLKQYLTGTVDGMEISDMFLLGAAVLMEIPFVMILLSRFLNYRANRWVNIVVGIFMTIVTLSTLFAGAPGAYFFFFGIIDVLTTLFIVWYAWRWKEQPESD